MKRTLILFFTSLLFLTNYTEAQEYYFRLIEPNKEIINTTITRTISIDGIKGDTVFAYANQHEFEAIKSLGYEPYLLEHPGQTPKERSMATTVEAMANWNLYPTYEVYRALMKKFEQDYPNYCKLDSIGTSVQGRQLYVVKLSSNVQQEEAKPEFFYTSTMHGDETTGFVLMLRMIDYLLSNYGDDERVTQLLDQLDIYINPNANPDGTYWGGNHTVNNSRRANANNKDINRNFPDPKVGENPDGPYQPETIAMMDFAEEHNFVMSANIHGGVELANFPWDAWNTATNPHADHNWFYTISRQYADFAQENGPNYYFTGQGDGVTQGGDWYVVSGGRQDYMNYFHQCKEITLEISNTKNPASSQLPNFWNYNKEALLSHMEWLYVGIHGTVTNSQGEPLSLDITIADHDKDRSHTFTNPQFGNYVRPIEPGTYEITYALEGYITQTQTVTVPDYQTKVVKDVVLLLSGQTSLSGVVTDANSKLPIPGAKVELLNSTFGFVYTDSQGKYTFPAIAENTYQIKAFKEGYSSPTITKELMGDSNSADFELTPMDAESFEGDIPTIFSFAGGDWTRDNSTAHEGEYSLKSASIGDNQSTSMQVTLNVISQSEISFAYRVSSENNYDWLRFYIDGSEMGSWSGNKNWAETTYSVTPGEHTFKWTYSKDVYSSSGSDCAWIDLVSFPPTQSDVTLTVTHDNNPVEGATVKFNDEEMLTNPSGLVQFFNQARGVYSLSIEKEGFEPYMAGFVIRYEDVEQTIELTSPSSVLPIDNTLSFNLWPNPFSNSLNVDIYLDDASPVEIELFTISGQKVATLFNGKLQYGNNSITLNMGEQHTKLIPGVYLIKIKTEQGVKTERAIFNGR